MTPHRAQVPGAHRAGRRGPSRGRRRTTEADLDELALLVDTAGADVVDRVVQRRDRPDPATYVGRGKAEELHELSLAVDADTVVFDDELPRPSSATWRRSSVGPPSTARR